MKTEVKIRKLVKTYTTIYDTITQDTTHPCHNKTKQEIYDYVILDLSIQKWVIDEAIKRIKNYSE